MDWLIDQTIIRKEEDLDSWMTMGGISFMKGMKVYSS